jgi:hypothetical protein
LRAYQSPPKPLHQHSEVRTARLFSKDTCENFATLRIGSSVVVALSDMGNNFMLSQGTFCSMVELGIVLKLGRSDAVPHAAAEAVAT